MISSGLLAKFRDFEIVLFFTIQLDHSYQGIIEMFMYTGKGNTLPTLRPLEFAYIAFIAEAAVSLSGHCESTK